MELLSLVPLRFQTERCVLVGDPKQLPATTFSRRGDLMRFNRSLFERLQATTRDAVECYHMAMG